MTSVFGSLKISPASDKYLHQIHGFIRVLNDGRSQRIAGVKTVPAGTDPSTGVRSNDVVISPETNLSARLYIPKTTVLDEKLPVLIFFHGGGFVVESAASPTYHPTLNLLVAESNAIVVSVDYRLAPEFPIPVAYEDSWEAIKWVASHGNKNGPSPWLNDHADLERVFFIGDSAGANIAHNMALRIGSQSIDPIKLEGLILLHPYFGGKDPIGSEIGKNSQAKAFTDQFWKLASSSESGLDDPLFNPAKDPSISGLGCSRVLVCVAEKDSLRDRGLYYKEVMEGSGWKGTLELVETQGQDHVFFLFDLFGEKACTLRNSLCTFINRFHSKV